MNRRLDARPATSGVGDPSPMSEHEARRISTLKRVLAKGGVREIQVPQRYTQDEAVLRMRVLYPEGTEVERTQAAVLLAEDFSRFLTTVSPSRLVAFEEDPKDPIDVALKAYESPTGSMMVTIFDMTSKKGLAYVQANETYISVSLSNPYDPREVVGSIGKILNRQTLIQYAERFGTGIRNNVIPLGE